MQPYQNFQQPIPMQFQYQPYGQPQMPTAPYMDRLSQLQAMQQNLQASPQQQFTSLNGRVVDNLDNIMASDVPMDGSFALFPRRDMSEVYIKYWTNEGKIATVVFKPISEPQGNNLSPDVQSFKFDEISSVLGGIYDKVDTLSNKVDEILKTKPSSRSKKEASSDE